MSNVKDEGEDDGEVLWQDARGNWQDFYFAAQCFLRRHFKLTEKPKRLWCRLLYQDKTKGK